MELHGLASGVQLVGAGFAMRVAIPTNEGYRNLPIRAISTARSSNALKPVSKPHPSIASYVYKVNWPLANPHLELPWCFPFGW
jgi:hypothetical protein